MLKALEADAATPEEAGRLDEAPIPDEAAIVDEATTTDAEALAEEDAAKRDDAATTTVEKLPLPVALGQYRLKSSTAWRRDSLCAVE